MRPIKEANRITKIWRRVGPNTYPIDLSLVVTEILNKSSGGDTAEIVSDSFDDCEGALIAGENQSWAIVLNNRIRLDGRRNFTFAHEIGHFVCHRHLRKVFRDGNDQLHDFSNDEIEQEANIFAAQLLMPQDIVRPYTKQKFNFGLLSDMADALAVSKQAAGMRWIQTSQRLVGFVVSRDGFVIWGKASDEAFKNGIFFRKETEIPSNSLTQNVQQGKSNGDLQRNRAWHPHLSCNESVHMSAYGDYTYTCLEFF